MQTRFIQSGFYYHFRKKKQYYIYLDMLQIITEKKVIHDNEIAFILFHNLPCSNTVLWRTTVTAHLQLPLQPFLGLLEHLIKSRIAIVASGRSL